jgi:hypothetical protein
VNNHKKTRKVGRTKLSRKEARKHIIPLGITGDELKSFREAAKKNNLTLSKWIRQILQSAI